MVVLRRGGCLGSGAFKQERLAPMEGRLGEHHSGELRLESAEAKAERILGAELARWGWTEPELAARRKSDPDKLRIAARLRRATTLSVKAIAARMHLGTSRSANARLHQSMDERIIQIGSQQPRPQMRKRTMLWADPFSLDILADV